MIYALVKRFNFDHTNERFDQSFFRSRFYRFLKTIIDTDHKNPNSQFYETKKGEILAKIFNFSNKLFLKRGWF